MAKGANVYGLQKTGLERYLRMSKFTIRQIISRLRPKLQQTPDFNDYLALYDEGAYQEAYAVLRDILKNQAKWSKNGNVYLMCADLELLANDAVYKARELLDKAIELGCSEEAWYYNMRGYVLWRTGETQQGIKDLEKSVELDPCVTYLKTFGEILSCSNDMRAIIVWQRVLEQDPNNCLAHIYIGWEEAKSGDRGKALLMAKRAEKLNPSVQEVFEIGRLYQELEDFQTAINTYLEANNLGYDDKALLYASVAACYLSLGQATPAKKYAQWAVQCDPENDYAKEIWREYEERFGG